MTNVEAITQSVTPADLEHIDELRRINAQMFEGTINLLSQQNTRLLVEEMTLRQQLGEDVTQLFEGTIRALSEQNTELHEQNRLLQKRTLCNSSE